MRLRTYQYAISFINKRTYDFYEIERSALYLFRNDAKL